MEQMTDIKNLEYVYNTLGFKLDQKIDAIKTSLLCDVALRDNDEELFWRSWAVTGQLLSVQPKEIMTTKQKNNIINEMTEKGRKKWGHEKVACPIFN